ncbi:hypothetical protein BpHYR1_036389 [Brachionus plicatilis]|uniref:Uncharacterized protein n=1 Tax=Brachionus plicatilis TaxID=10195 RepID=A0A3M7SP75_BRAPC|nr:hypothetical protein BpHYR1_036389 [Brachionus plicatilis]
MRTRPVTITINLVIKLIFKNTKKNAKGNFRKMMIFEKYNFFNYILLSYYNSFRFLENIFCSELDGNPSLKKNKCCRSKRKDEFMVSGETD